MTEKEEKASPGAGRPGEEQKPVPDIEKLSKERDEYLDGWKRAKADLINYKKDELRRLEEVARFGAESLILELISILDDFDLALATLEKQGATEKGLYLIKSRFEDILKRRGLEKIEVKTGDKFDPAFHEAIAVLEAAPSDAKVMEGIVAEEIETGYMLHGKVIRPTRVKVYK